MRQKFPKLLQQGSRLSAGRSLSFDTNSFGSILKITFTLLLLCGSLTPTSTSATEIDLSSWTYRQLIAQTIFVCSNADSIKSRNYQVKAGLGGIALVGNGAGMQISKDIKHLKSLSPRGVPVWIASDEEGGQVQRLSRVIYPLPSAKQMGTWTNHKLEQTAYQYGLRMKKLGIDLAFSPVADLAFPGFFISQYGRSFGRNSNLVSQKVIAWSKGLQRAGIEPTVKHWPGHGAVGNTHKTLGKTKPIAKMNAEMKPFLAGFKAGVKVVMVGHLAVPGLTGPRTPASRSKSALTFLRNQIGDDGVIMTDALSMKGSSSGLKGNIADAAVKSLAAGADVALVCAGPRDLISQVAVKAQRFIGRAKLEEKVHRILNLKLSQKS